MRRSIVYREIECREVGQPRCLIVGKPVDAQMFGLGINGKANTATVNYAGGPFTIPINFEGGVGPGSDNTLKLVGGAANKAVVTFTSTDANGHDGYYDLRIEYPNGQIDVYLSGQVFMTLGITIPF